MIRSTLSALREKLFKTKETINLLKEINAQNRILHEEQLATDIISKYLGKRYFPTTDYSISPIVIKEIFNDLLFNKCKNIIEFGSGLSTVSIARFIIKEDIDCTIHSIENDEKWISTILKFLKTDANDKRINLIHAPIQASPFSYKGHDKWYDINALAESIKSKKKFDLVLVDGPKGSLCPFSRYGFIPFLANRISNDPIIYIDDFHREEEKELAGIIAANLNLKSKPIGNRTIRLA